MFEFIILLVWHVRTTRLLFQYFQSVMTVVQLLSLAESSVCSMSSQSSGISETSSGSCHLHNRDFKIIIDVKTGCPQVVVHLVAPTMQEKAAWISDISQVFFIRS